MIITIGVILTVGVIAVALSYSIKKYSEKPKQTIQESPLFKEQLEVVRARARKRRKDFGVKRGPRPKPEPLELIDGFDQGPHV